MPDRIVPDDGYLDEIARREGKAERVKRLLILLTFLAAVVTIGFLIWVVVLIRATQTANSPLVREAVVQSAQIKALAESIDSCVDQTTEDGDPVGDCYAEAQRNTQDIVGIPRGPINTVTVLATYCQLTKGADTIPEILACVDSQLAHLKGQP